MNEKYDPQKALKLAVMLGAALMENGAEIYRVEESIIHVLRAYGLKRIDVYALPNIIIVHHRDGGGHVLHKNAAHLPPHRRF